MRSKALTCCGSESSEGQYKVFSKVRRPKCEEESPEVLIREGPKELTLRAEEVGTQKSCINVAHIAQDKWKPPLVDADWHAFCQAIFKGIEGKKLGGIVRLLEWSGGCQEAK